MRKISKAIPEKYQSFIPAVILGTALLILYGKIAPGDDFFGAYTRLVYEPENFAEMVGLFNPMWLAPLLAPFVTMPGRWGYILFIGVLITVTIASTHILKGKKLLPLLSAQMFWILWWGQIDPLVILGLALGWTAVQKKNWRLQTGSLLLMSLKPQISLLPAVALWWWIGRKRWMTLAAFTAVLAFSIVIWGPWPLWVIEEMVNHTSRGGFELWNTSLGFYAAPLLIPALFLPLEKKSRLIALTATGMLISPYLPYYSTLLLLCFPLPPVLYGFGLIGYFPGVIGPALAWKSILLLPLSVLVWVYWPWIQSVLEKLRDGFRSKRAHG